MLLSLEKPRHQIAIKLQRDKKDLMNLVDETTQRRTNSVHRADRPQFNPTGEFQLISYAWSKHAVDTIMHVCLALDKLVATRMAELQSMNSA